jgi:hypothetical protein
MEQIVIYAIILNLIVCDVVQHPLVFSVYQIAII